MTVYTFGYSGKQPADIAGHVERIGGTIIDTRYLPVSRRWPAWGRRALQAQFQERYCWLPEFGNVNYGGGPIAVQDYPAGLAKLRALLLQAGGSPILLCVCSRLDSCHRVVVANQLAADLGAAIVHLQ